MVDGTFINKKNMIIISKFQTNNIFLKYSIKLSNYSLISMIL